MDQKSDKRCLVYVVNVDWYFKLHWLNRARASLARGYRVYLIAAFVTPGLKEEFESQGFECIHIQLSRTGINPMQEIQSAFHIYRTLKRIQPDIIHTITVKPNIYAGIAANRLGIASIKSITGLGAVFSSQEFFFRIIRKLILRLYKLTGKGSQGAFVFENTADQAVFKKNGLDKRQELIHIPGAGIDINRFRFFSKPPSNKLKVLFAARLLKNKGLDTLIQGVEKAKAKGCPCDLLVAGIFDPAAKAAYSKAEINSLAASGRIQWLGQVDDMPSLLQQVDVVALPTRYGEGIPRILIEAGAVGRLVIATNVPGCSQLIRNNVTGILVRPHDVAAVCMALLDIWNHPARYAKLPENLHKEILNLYTDNVVISRFLTLYARFTQA
ncbi:glycosyltransferase family 4 protein [uncultured Desulfobacter sp.]|uniref:glycosyltransferase family 4 protein n=1 Tax=uncultured Desulfobacter sp. TaxID=240139 RepID=UPI002AAB3F05|nr:glycosyltransferase family 4 protein [uncultured Desulfobacter sp.]